MGKLNKITLLAVANQSLSYDAPDNGARYQIRLYELAGGQMAADVDIDDVPILRGQRIVAGCPIIPYKASAKNANFVILTNGDDEPDWRKFGTEQNLFYGAV